jgi:hypothetical protein
MGVLIMKGKVIWVVLWLAAVMGTAVFHSRLQADESGFAVLVINEVDYDQGTQDGTEFIELKNTGNEAADLDSYYLELVDGNGGAAVYQTIDLPAATLAPDDYYVVCTNDTAVINCDFEFTGPIQDGAPDAVALLVSAALIDTVSYEGDTPDGYTEGSGVGLADNGSGIRSIARFPDGEDTNENNQDFGLRCSTPGLQNIAQNNNCDALFIATLDVGVLASPSGVPEPGGQVTIAVSIANDSVLNITLDALTGIDGQNLDGVGDCEMPQAMTGFGSYGCEFTAEFNGLFGEPITQTVTAAGLDDFGEPVVFTGTAVISITERIRWDLFLPIVFSPRPFGEPNDTCQQAYPLLLNQPGLFLAEDTVDWYTFNLPASGPVQVSLLNFVPAGGNLVVYRGECGAQTLVGSDGSTAVNRTLDLGIQPPGPYAILLITDGPLNPTDLYTLRVQSP